MDTKFNLYDLFGIFIPGGILCLVVYAFLSGMKLLTPVAMDWTQALLVLPVAYTVGTVIHHSARKVLHLENFSLKLLEKTDREFTDEFTDLLIAKIERTFKITSPTEQEKKRAFYQMSFMLCCDYVIQNGKGVYVENFNALYGMCRSMIVVTVTGMLLAIIYLLLRVPDGLGRSAIIAAIIIGGIAVAKAFHQGMVLNGRRYAISVYRSFFLLPIDSKEAAPLVALEAPVKMSLTLTQQRSTESADSAIRE